ncbi:dipicolinate synthase subunit DpsA [Paenibacillus aquistagni]|uniref:Dipicolinate synthase subunit A n=1 Tax=Paenibacillus aquistagni TaxID=1852522 RepID=A0A1X7IQW4_9BACL|nr:dipicolinate synthase subunit DpsA [Paenibacillus aquistagni]NMM51190.1 dipicolinate synthase subunit DpsA [Paenibacillus aquistagni]SMG16841.1 dipicolinate synthase subunit A [Paenibacillus aquistagni]
MLTGVHVVFLGGDARHLEVIQKLTELDASVTIIGFDQLSNPYHGVQRQSLSQELLRHADALVLPAVGTDDDGKVHAIFTSEELVLTEEHIASLPSHAIVFTGMAKPYLSTLCDKHKLRLIELFERDDVAIYNSIPTAEGAIMMAIQHTDITLHGSETMVLGMGRTGFTLARTLLGLGANVRVGVRRDEHFARATEMGFQPFYLSELTKRVTNIDLLFNTIPTMIVTAQVIAQMPNRAVLIDLASKPGGIDFRFAEKRGVKAMLAPGLPGIVAPKSAGRILAHSISQLLLEQMRTSGE